MPETNRYECLHYPYNTVGEEVAQVTGMVLDRLGRNFPGMLVTSNGGKVMRIFGPEEGISLYRKILFGEGGDNTLAVLTDEKRSGRLSVEELSTLVDLATPNPLHDQSQF